MGTLKIYSAECWCIQSHLSNHKNSTKNNTARVFSNLMFQGKVRNAINLLSRNSCQGILNPENTTEEINSNGVNHITSVKDVLRTLHPQGKQAPDEILIAESPDAPLMNSVLFDEIDAEFIQRAALNTQGGAGPSRVDALGWRRFLYIF